MAEPRPNRVSLHAVARAAGVSAMSVSRALRNAAGLSEPTRERIRAVARRLGYQPDPHIARLMVRVRGFRRRRQAAVIAVVRDDIPEDELHDPAYQYVSIDDIRRRAEQHGYRVEEFWLGNGGMTPARLGGILVARGIEGMIVSPQSSRKFGAQLDFAPFAVATFGYGLQYPPLHRASANITRGILDATATLVGRGYRRIGLAITRWVDERSDSTYSGAMLRFQQQVPAADRVPMLLFPDNNLSRGAEVFCRWFKRHRPDVVISFSAHVRDWLALRLRKRIPDDVGFVVHDWVAGDEGIAGINHQRSEIAAAAVDLLATQLMHNERGVPKVPRQVLTPALWVEGMSIRPPGAS